MARCPECRNYFCRECVTEHQGRLVCASCLQRPEETKARKTASVWNPIANTFKAAFGILLAWIFFYAIGQLLLLIPDSFHSGNIWRSV